MPVSNPEDWFNPENGNLIKFQRLPPPVWRLDDNDTFRLSDLVAPTESIRRRSLIDIQREEDEMFFRSLNIIMSDRPTPRYYSEGGVLWSMRVIKK